jgi:atypical dual specificity phosphatase
MAPLVFQVNPEYAQISEIAPSLFICGVSALSEANMKAFKITFIINATNEVPNLKLLGNAQRMKLWIDDIPEEQGLSPQQLDLLADQINLNICDGGHVLVHCVAGVSRSATICLAYLTKYHCRSLRDAYHLMCSKRPMVRPNIGFWRQLINYEQILKGTSGSVRIIRDDAQDGKLIPDVYLKEIIPDRSPSPEDPEYLVYRERNNSGSSRNLKFHPILETLSEIAELAA